MNLDDFETPPVQYKFPGLRGVLSLSQQLIKAIIEHNQFNEVNFRELFKTAAEKEIYIAFIKYEGLNLLELAVQRSDKNTVTSVLEHTDLVLTNTIAKPLCIACKPSENPDVISLINSIRFADFDLLVKLNSRSVPGRQILNKTAIDIAVIGENPLCFALRRRHSEAFFKSLFASLRPYLDLKCRSNLSPLGEAIKLGYTSDGYELPALIETACTNSTECRVKLICTKDSTNNNAIDYTLTAQNNAATLKFLYKNGGSNCWQPNYPLITTSNSHASTAVSTCVLGLCVSDPITLLVSLILGLGIIGLVYLLLNRRKNHTTRFIEHEAVMPIIAELTKENRFSLLKYNGWFSIKNKQYHVRHRLPNERQQFIDQHFTELYHEVQCIDVNRDVRGLPFGMVRNRHLRLISPVIQDEKIITFYIPGTASVTTSAPIETCIGKHLAHALECQVLILDHDLAPETDWPHNITQICNFIQHFIDEHPEKTTYYLAGFSTGGYFATLATFILSKKHKYFQRHILFAPLLDIGGELRKPQFSKWSEEQLRQLPIPNDFKLDTVSRFRHLRKLIDKHEYFETRFSELHECIITDTFPQYKDPDQLAKLREVSPLWFNTRSFDPRLFPDTTIIVGQKDCFRIDSEVFYAKLKDNQCNVTKIVLPNLNHGLLWKWLFPIYFAQPITRPDEEITTSYERILHYDEKLKIVAGNDSSEKGKEEASAPKKLSQQQLEEKILNRSDKLKLLCQSLSWLRTTNDAHQPADDKNLSIPIFTRHKLV